MAKKKPAKPLYMRKGMTTGEWMDYIMEGFATEPKTIAELEGQAFQASIRTTIFGSVMIYRMFKNAYNIIMFVPNLIRKVFRMFGRGKKKDDRMYLPPANYPYVDPRTVNLPQVGQPQPVNPYQPLVAQPYPAQPQPAVPAGQQQLSAYQQQQQHEFALNPINGIIMFMRQLDERISQIEVAVDELISRVNLIQGIQPVSERRIRFTSASKG